MALVGYPFYSFTIDEPADLFEDPRLLDVAFWTYVSKSKLSFLCQDHKIEFPGVWEERAAKRRRTA